MNYLAPSRVEKEYKQSLKIVKIKNVKKSKETRTIQFYSIDVLV